MGRQRARPHLRRPRWSFRRGRRRGRQAGAATDPVAGNRGAVPLHRAARRAGGDRRDAEARPDAGGRRRCARRRGGGSDGPLYYNSVIAIDDSGEIVDAVDKVHLVPFGEYLPFADVAARFGIEQLVAGPMNFVAGSQRHPLELPGGIKASPFICYEIIFPDLVAVDATSTRFIVNVTNDAWFGDTPGPYQHFRQAQVRAVENGLPLLRAANNGISGVIDARGRVIDALALNVSGRSRCRGRGARRAERIVSATVGLTATQSWRFSRCSHSQEGSGSGCRRIDSAYIRNSYCNGPALRVGSRLHRWGRVRRK